MKTDQSEMWEKIMLAGEQVAYAYQQMLKAADDLADVVEYNEDYVLRQVLPKAVAERRDCERVLGWLKQERDDIEAHVLARQAARAAAARREALLAKLNLTKDEQRLLGIKAPE
jgi:hypothetical protein